MPSNHRVVAARRVAIRIASLPLSSFRAARADATARVKREAMARLLNGITPADATARLQRGPGSSAPAQ